MSVLLNTAKESQFLRQRKTSSAETRRKLSEANKGKHQSSMQSIGVKLILQRHEERQYLRRPKEAKSKSGSKPYVIRNTTKNL